MARWNATRHIPVLPPQTALIVAHAASSADGRGTTRGHLRSSRADGIRGALGDLGGESSGGAAMTPGSSDPTEVKRTIRERVIALAATTRCRRSHAEGRRRDSRERRARFGRDSRADHVDRNDLRPDHRAVRPDRRELRHHRCDRRDVWSADELRPEASSAARSPRAFEAALRQSWVLVGDACAGKSTAKDSSSSLCWQRW